MKKFFFYEKVDIIAKKYTLSQKKIFFIKRSSIQSFVRIMDYSECSFLELTKDERGTSSFLFQLLYPFLHFTSDYNDYPYSLQFSHMNGNFNDEYYKESIYVGYRYFDRLNISPKYSLGYGIGYSTFSIENPQVEIDKENIIVGNCSRTTLVAAKIDAFFIIFYLSRQILNIIDFVIAGII